MKPRRLVNIHVSGKFAGVAHIHGVETGTPLTDAQMPPLVECQFLDGESRQTAMAWTNERVVVYREVEA